MNESLKISLKKAGRAVGVEAFILALLAGLGFLADPVALQAVVKDPPKELLLLYPVVNYAAKVAMDQARHRFIPWIRAWAEGDAS